jgi:hypothetical protein
MFLKRILHTKSSQKVPEILWHRRIGALWVRTAWTVLLVVSTWKFCRGSGATSGRQGQWFMHHDNAPSHTSLVVITQPPHSPDLAPSDFGLFPTLKMGLKGTHFATMEGIKWNAAAELRKIPKAAFCRCFQQWLDRLSMCVYAQGVLLWWWSGKRCRMSYQYSTVSQFRELFDCPSYFSSEVL